MATGNFNACLAEILKHEGGFVNHSRVDVIDKLRHKDLWLTQQNSLIALILHLCRRAHLFIKKLTTHTLDLILAKLMAVSTTHTRQDYAMPTTLEVEGARIYRPLCATGKKKTNAENATIQLTRKVGGHFAKAITAKEGARSCVASALRLLVAAVQNAEKYIRITSMTFIIQATRKKILQSAKRLKAIVPQPLPQKLRSAFFSAQIAIG